MKMIKSEIDRHTELPGQISTLKHTSSLSSLNIS